jgi:hypothetical protein
MARNAVGMVTPIAIFALVERPVCGVGVVSEVVVELVLDEWGEFERMKRKLKCAWDSRKIYYLILDLSGVEMLAMWCKLALDVIG